MNIPQVVIQLPRLHDHCWSQARYQVLFALGVAAVKIHVGWFCDLEDMMDMCNAQSMSLVSGSKGHHGVKRASNYHPWMLNMTTCTDHQLFIFREKLWIFLSVLEVGNLSLFTTFKKQFGLGRWKRGPPRIEHSIHSNFSPLNISLLDRSLFLTIYNDSYSFITTYVHRYINIYLKTLCLMLCMEFCLFDLHQGKRCGKSMTLEP